MYKSKPMSGLSVEGRGGSGSYTLLRRRRSTERRAKKKVAPPNSISIKVLGFQTHRN